jgi:hypothetical protein
MLLTVVAVALNLLLWLISYRLITSLTRSPFILLYGLCAITLIMSGLLTSGLGLPERHYLIVEAVPLALTAVVFVAAARRHGGGPWSQRGDKSPYE